jgi:hypothetical protein
MGDVVPFPRRPISHENAPRTTKGEHIDVCREPIHVFEHIGTYCQCGSQFWPNDPSATEPVAADWDTSDDLYPAHAIMAICLCATGLGAPGPMHEKHCPSYLMPA